MAVLAPPQATIEPAAGFCTLLLEAIAAGWITLDSEADLRELLAQLEHLRPALEADGRPRHKRR
jgi:hypothetical protein